MARSSIVSTLAIAGIAFLASNASRAAPDVAGPEPIASYRAYASAQAGLLVRMTRMLAKDVRDGDVQAAQNDYAPTRRYLERIRPLLAAKDDLARRMDAGAEAYPGRERDPAFAGFHRIEHALFALKSTKNLEPVADRLYEDTLRLQESVATQPMRPEMLVNGPVELVEQVALLARDGGREPYARTDLWDIEADLDGAREMVAAARPKVEARDPLAMARIDAAFAATGERLAQLRDGCGFKAYDQLTPAYRASLGETTRTLAREVGKLKNVPAID